MSKSLHRIRSRKTAPPGTEWEFFQTLLGFAFTVQQELKKQRLSEPVTAELAEGINPVLQRVAACARNLTDATGAAIALGSADEMVCIARSGQSAPPVGARLDSRSGLSGECIRSGECAICVNASADPRVNYQACRTLDVASMLYFPLRSAQGKLIGVLGVFSSKALHFSQRDIACLRFVEPMVQDALGLTSGEPEPASFGGTLRQADAPAALVKVSEVRQEPAKTPVVALPVPVKLTPVAPTASPVAIVKEAPRAIKAGPKPEPIFVGRVVDESVRDSEIELPSDVPLPLVMEPRSRIPLVLMLVVLLLIAAAAWNYGKFFHGTETSAAHVAPKVEPTAPAAATSNTDVAPSEQVLTSAVSLRSMSAYATVTILLPHAIRAEGYGLSNPDRIYFDLHDVKLTDAKGTVFKSDEGLISRVRLAQSAAGVTRVVFDLREPASFESRQEQNPQRLIIEMRRTGAAHNDRPTPSGSTKVTIVIDPGHGGRDLGTVSPSGLQEKDLTLDVALRLGLLLQERLGANVVYTRDKDEFVSLDDRAAVANRTQAAFLISIHGNSSALPSVRGVETYYFKVPAQPLAATKTQLHGDSAKAFAADVHSGLLRGLAEPQLPMQDRGVRPASFVVLRQAQMPAVLAEISYISNQEDAPRLETASYREQIAKALYSGIANHLSRSGSRSSGVADMAVQHWSGTP